MTWTEEGSDSASTEPSETHRRPWGWIAACVLLVLVAGGLAIWALSLQSDLDDQRDQTAAAQQQAQQSNDQVSALSDQVDEMSQTISDASDRLSQAGSNAQEEAQQALDGLKANLESLRDDVAKAVEESGAETP